MRRGRILELALRLAEKSIYVLFSHRSHFLNPLVERELRDLDDCEALDDDGVLAVVERLEAESSTVEQGLYFPTPMARSLAAGTDWDVALSRFSYEMIRVDDDGAWTWKGGPVAPRTRDFFLEHVGFEPELGRWFFEYRVNDGWWDKSYLEASVSPLTAIRLQPIEDSGRELRLEAECASGQRGLVLGEGLRLDEAERLFVAVRGLGEVQLSQNLRFEVLKTVSEDLCRVDVGGRAMSLAWPSGAEPVSG